MYLSGYVINMSYITDSNKNAVIKNNCIGLSVLSVSTIQGGQILKKGTHNTVYKPLPIRVTDDGDKFYDLYPGAYQIVFEQGLTKLPKDCEATLVENDFCHSTGAIVLPHTYFEFDSKSNITTTLIVPEHTKVSLELGCTIADLFVKYEKTMEEM